MFSSNSSQVSDEKLYSEDVFSTFVYTGNGGTQTITNGIDLAGKGGLVWIKARSVSPAQNHFLFDTSRGSDYRISSNTTDAQDNSFGSQYLSGFNSNGFSLEGRIGVNGSTYTYASWTFREAPKFFDVVTYTGNGTAGRTVVHSLGVAPGTIIVKRTDAGAGWRVYHRSQPNGYGDISSTDAFYTNSAERVFGNGSTVVAPTSTDFTIGDATSINGSGATFVAYLFAHDTTSDGIIQCGSATCSGGVATINLGWEPQWILAKQTNTTGDWRMIDNMRGWTNNSGGNQTGLQANTSAAEASYGWGDTLSPTGCNLYGGSTDTFIYIAIRRGPMRTPTTGTSVFSPQATTLNTGSNTVVSSGTAGPMDMVINQQRSASGGGGITQSRLTGGNYLITSSTAAETSSSYTNWDRMTDTKPLPWTDGQSVAVWQFKRAPSFFDEVCYTGTGSARTVSHNLGVAPQLWIIKCRSTDGLYNWNTGSAAFATPSQQFLALNKTDAISGNTSIWNNTAPTSTVFSLGTPSAVNESGQTYVAYLFASCPGVSKVFSFTGNGSSQTINCGFSGGARFILIKRTDSTGNWVVFDSARGIVSGNDPSLLLNSTAAETNYDDIDPDSSGFVVNQSTNNLNVNGASYIGLAIS